MPGSLDVRRLITVRSDRLVEHRRRAHLDGAASEQEVVERVREVGDAADPRERLLGEGARQLRHLRERQRQDGGAAHPAARHEAVDVHLELERFGIDERQRREGVRRCDRVAAAAEHRARLLAMSLVAGVSFAHTGTVATSFTTWVTKEHSAWSLPMFEPMSAPIHVRARQVQLEAVGARVLAGAWRACASDPARYRCPSRP